MNAKRNTWIVISFWAIGLMVFLLSKQSLISNVQKPIEIVSEKKREQNNKNNLSCEMNQEPKEGKKHNNGHVSGEDLKLLESLEIIQDFDEVGL